MCELMGLTSLKETTITRSLSILVERGGKRHLNGDGWGIAFHNKNDVRLIKDTEAASQSEWVEFLKQHELTGHDIIAHIRKSTVGEVNYSNTHPFSREVIGYVHSFAHNGTIKNLIGNKEFPLQHFHPVGDTDSEYLFCALLEEMYPLWEKAHGIPSLEERVEVLVKFTKKIAHMGRANFLYCDGDAFFARGDERHDPATDKIVNPGLYYLEQKNPQVTLFASVPLDDQDWHPVRSGELVVCSKGKVISVLKTLSRHQMTLPTATSA